MISKNKLKELAAYRLQKRQDEAGVFVVEGPKMAAEAMTWGAEVVCTCATDEWAPTSGEPSGEFYRVSQAELERLSLMRAPNQVWMLVHRPQNGQMYSHLTAQPLVLALDRLQDPGNMGTILRTADWYGVRHVVCSADTVSCYNAKVVQASMGAVFRTWVEYVDLPHWLDACGMPVYGATLDGEPLGCCGAGQSDASPRVLLVGNEGRGISPEAMDRVTHRVTIPNLGGTAESLNAAVAAAIMMKCLLR